MLIPTDWMPTVQMKRIVLHWTAGGHKATDFDRKHYHILIEDDGNLVRGFPSIALNAATGAKKGYAAHTRNCNTGSIGVSMCCMAGAVEKPFNAGKFPLTERQWHAAGTAIAQLCRRYSITPSPKTVLTHAEVQANLGIAQRGKWDIAKLPFDPSFDTARECGDRLRREVAMKH